MNHSQFVMPLLTKKCIDCKTRESKPFLFSVKNKRSSRKREAKKEKKKSKEKSEKFGKVEKSQEKSGKVKKNFVKIFQ